MGKEVVILSFIYIFNRCLFVIFANSFIYGY